MVFDGRQRASAAPSCNDRRARGVLLLPLQRLDGVDGGRAADVRCLDMSKLVKAATGGSSNTACLSADIQLVQALGELLLLAPLLLLLLLVQEDRNHREPLLSN